ncbi:MAG: FAD:protein FMN transferase [Candidatus Symbiothrix sp.]|jgi:thiamine biosynthesis lipoprotein|nr:FAD:protein FMN transferase [Candidatus Symbiothrix sp.]
MLQRIFKPSAVVSLLILAGIYSSCKQANSYFLTQGEIFHTSTHIKYKYHKDLGNELFALLDRFDLSLNPFNSKSLLYQVNHNEAVEVDDWFITVFNKAQEVAELSGGAYDVTCAPLVNLWGFGFEKGPEVTPEVIDSLRQFVGYQKVRLEGRKVVKTDKRLQLDFASIAKGYAVDVIAGMLESYGINDYLVEIGGEVRCKGRNPEGKSWQIEILKPVDDRSGEILEKQQIITLDNAAMATSGNYRNYYIKDGKKYAHTIDPHTGYPAETNLLSASVRCPDCMTADAWATAFMSLGLEKACAVAEQLPDLEYLFIYTDEEGSLLERKSFTN